MLQNFLDRWWVASMEQNRGKALRIEKGKYRGNFKIDKANLLNAIKHLKKAKLSVSLLPFHYRTDESAKMNELEKITEYINSLENFADAP